MLIDQDRKNQLKEAVQEELNKAWDRAFEELIGISGGNAPDEQGEIEK
jgi:hypothetical protein